MKLFPWSVATCAFAFASQAHAAGYYSGEKGARVAGRAGAFTAKADDLMAVAYNPAGLSRIDGWLVQVGNRFSYNAYSFERKPTLDWRPASDPAGRAVPRYVEFPEVENGKPWQILDPLIGVASDLGLDDWGFAFVAYAPPGVARQEFPLNGGQRYMMVSRDAIILNYSLSAAWQFEELFGVGASFQWIAVPNVRYQLVITNALGTDAYPVSGPYDILATIEGSDPFTPNLVLGAWYRPVKFLEIGVSGQVIPAQIETESELSVEPLFEEDEDIELRREGELANDVSLRLPLPVTARLGIRYRHLDGEREVFDVELDVGYESWSRVDAFVVNGAGLEAHVFGEEIPVGLIEVDKQWQDTVSVQLGGDYAVLPGLVTARGGVSYETAVAKPAYAHVDFAGGAQLGFALGGSVFVQNFEIAAAYGLRHQLPVAVNERDSRVYQEVPAEDCAPPYTDPNRCHPQYLGRPTPPVNAGTYRAYSHVASLDVLYRF